MCRWPALSTHILYNFSFHILKKDSGKRIRWRRRRKTNSFQSRLIRRYRIFSWVDWFQIKDWSPLWCLHKYCLKDCTEQCHDPQVNGYQNQLATAEPRIHPSPLRTVILSLTLIPGPFFCLISNRSDMRIEIPVQLHKKWMDNCSRAREMLALQPLLIAQQRLWFCL